MVSLAFGYCEMTQVGFSKTNVCTRKNPCPVRSSLSLARRKGPRWISQGERLLHAESKPTLFKSVLDFARQGEQFLVPGRHTRQRFTAIQDLQLIFSELPNKTELPVLFHCTFPSVRLTRCAALQSGAWSLSTGALVARRAECQIQSQELGLLSGAENRCLSIRVKAFCWAVVMSLYSLRTPSGMLA